MMSINLVSLILCCGKTRGLVPSVGLICLTLLVSSVAGQTSRYQVGDIVENFTLSNRANGEEVSLYDLEGKVVFLEWFAHWCPFCKAAAFEVGPGIIDYYENRNGNPNGVPVMHVALNLQGGAETSTQNFINFYGIPFVLNDFNRAVANRFQAGGQPIFAIINGVANSPDHQQWELLYSRLGYGDLDHPIDEFRTAINQVKAAVEIPGFDAYVMDLGVPENQSAETDDPDFDGLSNVFEYLAGTSAVDTASFFKPVNKIVSLGNEQYQALEYIRKTEVNDISVAVQFSSHPGFTTLNGSVPYLVEPLAAGFEKVVVRSNNPLGSGMEFSRLVVSFED